ncbi:hypothetical protein I7X12_16995 [Halosimplex litoreum]|uniref:Uncharacterized protein n=1 Tax=Halosimplex litoreum TaxID=1198301 RepID=A0A7T3FXG4_9EURY|nr:hypothetical protein [Halosimplex litoreum]QPV62416.1 hypothetical protein I7X12_16995 [Halosimplex litoreum]
MQRRTVLRGLAALAAGAGAGCTADGEVPATAPEPPEGIATPEEGGDGGDRGGGGDDGDAEPTPDQQRFVVPGRTFRSDENGDLVVEVTVRNRVGVAHEAVMTVTVEAGDRTFSPSRHVVLQPQASGLFEIRFPITEGQLTGFAISFDSGPPETPIPDGTVTPYPEDRVATETGTRTDRVDRTATDPSASATAVAASTDSTGSTASSSE